MLRRWQLLADFLVDLEAALQLRLIERAEQAGEAPALARRASAARRVVLRERDGRAPPPSSASARKDVCQTDHVGKSLEVAADQREAGGAAASAGRRVLGAARRRRSRRAPAWSSRPARAPAARRAGSRNSRAPECAPPTSPRRRPPASRDSRGRRSRPRTSRRRTGTAGRYLPDLTGEVSSQGRKASSTIAERQRERRRPACSGSRAGSRRTAGDTIPARYARASPAGWPGWNCRRRADSSG